MRPNCSLGSDRKQSPHHANPRAAPRVSSLRRRVAFGGRERGNESDAPARGSEPPWREIRWGRGERGVGADGYARATLYRARRRRFVALDVKLLEREVDHKPQNIKNNFPTD